ncbi:DNA metabolism protein [Clostridium botulinum]|nr:DNA metabolism protein [Clostridium botulinum]
MKILIYDDTFFGLLNALYKSFNYDQTNLFICSKKNNIPLLGSEIINVNTNSPIAKKVQNTIIYKIDKLALKKIYIVYLSNYENKEILLLKYLKIAFKLNKDVHSFLNIDEVRLIDTINKKVTYESHRFKGFVRFNLINNKFFYSSIEPDNDILELIADHFKKRFKNEYFIIHDLNREKAIIYNKIDYEIIPLDLRDYEKLKTHSDNYGKLWSTYFKSTAIIERKNLKLQSRMMPKRYWKHIIEVND